MTDTTATDPTLPADVVDLCKALGVDVKALEKATPAKKGKRRG